MSSKNNPSFWTTIPGIITGIAAVVGSITGLLVAIERIYPSTDIPTLHSINDTIKQTPKSSTNLTPITNAGLNQSLIEGAKNIVLNGSESIDQDGDKLTYLWKQISGEPVYLKYIDKPISLFDSPNVTKDTQLIFRLTVDDNRRLQDTAIVSVKILNNENNDALLFKDKGLEFNKLGRYNESLKYFKQAFTIYQKRLEIYPSNAQIWIESGDFLSKIMLEILLS